MEFIVVLALALVVAWVLAAPLRAGRAEREEAGLTADEADLEAARDAKYAEIREAELDFRAGKLSEADWRTMDRRLRGEAIDLLARLDELRGR